MGSCISIFLKRRQAQCGSVIGRVITTGPFGSRDLSLILSALKVPFTATVLSPGRDMGNEAADRT